MSEKKLDEAFLADLTVFWTILGKYSWSNCLLLFRVSIHCFPNFPKFYILCINNYSTHKNSLHSMDLYSTNEIKSLAYNLYGKKSQAINISYGEVRTVINCIHLCLPGLHFPISPSDQPLTKAIFLKMQVARAVFPSSLHSAESIFDITLGCRTGNNWNLFLSFDILGTQNASNVKQKHADSMCVLVFILVLSESCYHLMVVTTVMLITTR